MAEALVEVLAALGVLVREGEPPQPAHGPWICRGNSDASQVPTSSARPVVATPRTARAMTTPATTRMALALSPRCAKTKSMTAMSSSSSGMMFPLIHDCRLALSPAALISAANSFMVVPLVERHRPGRTSCAQSAKPASARSRRSRILTEPVDNLEPGVMGQLAVMSGSPAAHHLGPPARVKGASGVTT